MKAFFSGDPIIKFPLNEPRIAVFVEPFTFTDSLGVEWTCNPGDHWDGSSIPSFLWSLLKLSPFVGLHRLGAGPHDKECRERNHSWQKVHAMYEEAIRTAGEPQADVLAFAVNNWGPRWNSDKSDIVVELPSQSKINELKSSTQVVEGI